MLLPDRYGMMPRPRRRLRPTLVALTLGAASSFLPIATADAQNPVQVCKHARTSDTLRNVPASLASEVNALFGTRMSAQEVARSTFYRCAGGRVLLCTVGANLPCGKADVSRSSPGAAAYCRQNPGSDFIPAFATGHGTIFEWRCIGPKPAVVRQIEQVDARGFVRRYWKALP